jgi:methionine-rich copper-binding protein CopC
MRQLVLALILGGATAAVSADAAWSHAFLDSASPAVGGTVSAAPAEIRLSFSEDLEPRFSGIDVTAADGHAIQAGRAAPAPGNPRQLVMPLPPLPPGGYKVHWHVVSVDTHQTEGDFTFEIRP